jgi:hypothetical protein
LVNSRAKGAAFETKLCGLLKKITGKGFTRTPGSGAAATRTGNAALAGDVMGVNHKFPWVLELKKYKSVDFNNLLTNTGNLVKWVEQLERERFNRPGMLIFAENYGKIKLLVKTDLTFKHSFIWNGYTIGLFNKVMPELWRNYIK